MLGCEICEAMEAYICAQEKGKMYNDGARRGGFLMRRTNEKETDIILQYGTGKTVKFLYILVTEKNGLKVNGGIRK